MAWCNEIAVAVGVGLGAVNVALGVVIWMRSRQERRHAAELDHRIEMLEAWKASLATPRPEAAGLSARERHHMLPVGGGR